MFNNLLESKKKKQKTLGGTLFSFVAHGTLIPLAVIATATGCRRVAQAKGKKS